MAGSGCAVAERSSPPEAVQTERVCVICERPLIAIYVNGQLFPECPLHGSRGIKREPR